MKENERYNDNFIEALNENIYILIQQGITNKYSVRKHLLRYWDIENWSTVLDYTQDLSDDIDQYIQIEHDKKKEMIYDFPSLTELRHEKERKRSKEIYKKVLAEKEKNRKRQQGGK